MRFVAPCARLERIADSGLLRPFVHRSGIRVDILGDGTLHAGGTIST
jgi:hypothetical protein